MKTYAFINDEQIVVQVIVGDLDEQSAQRFIADYNVLFGATSVVEVPEDSIAWIGGKYTDGVFLSPPPPPVAPIVIDGTSEEIAQEPA